MCATEFEAKRPSARYCSDRCRQRAKRAGAAVSPPSPPTSDPADGKSGAAARAWLTAKGIDAETVPAAADLLVVADAIDAATSAGQIQFVAALARQAAALRAELAPKADTDEPGPPEGGQEEPRAGTGPQPRSFDASSL
jgi:hypothetical protein